MNSANKYQPYWGYHRAQPWLGYGVPGYGRRIRTRSDWHYDRRPWSHRLSKSARRASVHADGRRWPFWDRPQNSSGTVFQKREVHRRFRRLAKQAIWRELDGEEVSHTIRSCSALGMLD